jgi:ribose-phosphate pyrophosphokinase
MLNWQQVFDGEIMEKRLHILSGSHSIDLVQKVAKRLKSPLHPLKMERFANGEIKYQLEESVRGGNVFVFQTHSQPVNDAIVEQAIIIDAAKRASAKNITAVCPYLGYSRQDRKAYGREPITARLVIDILAMAGADRIVAVNLHSGQTQGFFNGPFDHLTALPVLAKYLKKKFNGGAVVVSPDSGRVKLADRYAKQIGADLAIVHKRRAETNKAEALDVIGEVAGRDCIIVDDMIDTGGTICAAADLLKRRGARSVSAAASHGLFSPPAQQSLAASAIDSIVVSDTVPLSIKLSKPKIEVVSVAALLAAAIKAIHEESSVSAIFDGSNQI